MRTAKVQETESFEFRSALQKNSGRRRSARLFGCALLSMLVGAFAQQSAFSAPQDERTDSSAQRGRDQAGGQQAQEKGGAELDDPRARLEWRLKTRGIPTVASKQHLMKLWQAQSVNLSSSPAAINAPTGPQWVPIGPTGADYEQNGAFTGFVRDSGRVRTILPNPTDPNTVYLLTAGGGLWVTNNFTANSSTWRPLTDSLFTTSGGSVAFGRTPSVLYLGLGDPFELINVGGVMAKSIDGGVTWTNVLDLGTPFSVRDIKVDTSGAQDIVLVATDTGLFRSTDSGASFVQIPLGGASSMSVWSLVETSAGWVVNAQPCPNFRCFFSNIPASLYISTDHGATWAPIRNSGNVYTGAGRTTLGVGTPGDSVVYAFAGNSDLSDQLDLFRSTNGGQDWTALSINSKAPTNPNAYNPDMDLMHYQSWYNQMILVDPRDVARNTVYLGGNLSTAKSTDGGNTWTLLSTWIADHLGHFALPYVHADAHAAAISNVPGATPVVLFGNDGGLFVSTDDGTTWSSDKNNGLQTFLFYSLTSTPEFPSAVMGGTQDNGMRVRKGNSTIYNETFSGDVFGAVWSQANANASIATLLYNWYDINLTNQVPDNIEDFLQTSPPLVNDAITAAPIESPAPTADPTGKVFFTMSEQQVYKTIDGGITWTVIGSVGAATHTIPATVFLTPSAHSVGVSPVDLGHIGVLASGGHAVITTDGGATWTDRALAPGFFTSSTFIWADNQTMYVASAVIDIGGPRVAKSTDGGVSWARADSGLPDVPIERVIVDPRDTTHNTLLAATDQGVFRSTNGGVSWTPYGTGLPNTFVTDIYVPPDGSFLRVATYGRGIWELPFLSFGGATLTDDVASCDNNDGSLDNGESGRLTITLHNDGSNALNGITATVSSTNPNVSFPNGNAVNFPPAAASANTTATMVVKLSGATGIQQLDFSVAFTDPALGFPVPVRAMVSFRANYHDMPNSSANDDIGGTNSPWTVTGTPPSLPDITTWHLRQIGPLDRRWAAVDSNGLTDVSLVSPVLQVGAGSLTISFEQRYAFEFASGPPPNWRDGMIIEASSDGGTTWSDIGMNASPGYDHILLVAGNGNVLEGRSAYSGISAGYPNFTATTINLGTQFAGKNVQIRFRVGTDIAGGNPGVEIRNITTTGLTNTPFTAVVASSGCLTPTSTSTSLTSTKNPSFFGDLVTFGATVAGGSTAATGTIRFKDGAVTIGTGALNGGGQTTLPTSTLSVGVHPITATYGGDSTHATSTSSAMQQMVSKALTATTLASSLNSALVGQSVTFTATVTSAGGTPGGAATFFDGATQLGTGTLSAQGAATFATSALAVGTHSITAVYGGDSNFTASVSVAVTETITTAAPAATTAALVSSPASASSGAPVTFTATISSTSSGTPTGTVSFLDGATTLGSGTLNSGRVATFTTSILTVGTHSITAKYSGSATFASSTSAALTETIAKTATTDVLVSSAASASSGTPVTFTATITSSTSGTPTGTVTFLDGTTTLGTVTLNGSAVATIATSTLMVGTHSITADYGGDSNFTASISEAVTETITPAAPNATTATLISSAASASSGTPVTFTATITSSTSGRPTGTANFLDGTATIGSGTLNSGGVATLTTSTLTAGTHSITAAYGGDSKFAASTSTVLTQVILAPSFTVASTQSSVTVSAGNLANYPLMVTGKNNFSGTVTVSCTAGLPLGASCTTPSATITPSTTTSTAMLTINTAGRTTAVLLRLPEGRRAGFLAGWLLVSAIVLGILGLGVPRRRLRLGYVLALLLVSCALWQGGCGSASSVPINTTAGTPAGTYTVTLTGTSGTAQQTTSVTLVVQ